MLVTKFLPTIAWGGEPAKLVEGFWLRVSNHPSTACGGSPPLQKLGRKIVVLLTMLAFATPAAAQDKQPPYWASIASGKAMTRTGPAKNYPGTWLYQRRDLPVRVVKKHDSWRLIEDPDGVRGWMLVSLLSDRRTALVKAGDPRPVRTEPSLSGRVRYLAEPGIVGQIEQCRDGFCRIEIGKKKGYIATGDIYGLSPGEQLD